MTVRLSRRNVLAVGGSLALATFVNSSRASRISSTAGGWTQPRFDATKRGFVDSTAGPRVSDGSPEQRWQNDEYTGRRVPLVAGDYVYVPTGEWIGAIDRHTGAEDWRGHIGEGIVSPILVDDAIFTFDLETGRVSAIEANSGEDRFRKRLDSQPLTRLVGIDEVVLCGSAAGFHALDTTDGEQVWQTSLDGALTRPCAVIDDWVVVATTSQLYHLDVADGSIGWEMELLTEEPGGPVVTPDSMYVTVVEERPGDPAFAALDLVDGQERWRVDRYDETTAPAVSDERVYLGARRGGTDELVSLDAADGSEDWQVITDAPVSDPPIVDDTTVYAPLANGHLLALDAGHGGTRWELDVDQAGGSLGQPVIADGTLYVSGETVGLVALADPAAIDDDGPHEANDQLQGDVEDDAEANDEADDSAFGFGSGFAILSALAGAGGAAYLLNRRSATGKR